MSRNPLLFGGVLVSALLQGCQIPGYGAADGGRAGPATLGDLPPVTLPEAEETREPVSTDTVISSYRELLPLVEDPRLQVQIRHRLADLSFQQAENRFAEKGDGDLDGAVTAYTRLLEEFPDRAANDRILYQLARARALQGQTEQELQVLTDLVSQYPDSRYRHEAQFRRGDIFFSQRRYREAEAAFSGVARAADADSQDPELVTNAWYMSGWSQFKLGHYWPALESFVQVLDRVMPETGRMPEESRAQDTLLTDLFRVFGLSLSYLDGEDSLRELFRQTGNRPYEPLVYERYSDLLVAREQYTDAVASLEAFIREHPDSPWAPRYEIRIIGILAEADFVQELPERKARFVSRYGLEGDYWQGADEETRDYIRARLAELIPELADRHYLLADRATDPAEKELHYAESARYNRAFAATFPEHPATPERLFLLAESELALAHWPEAIQAFEQVAYGFTYTEAEQQKRAAEAGYAAVLAYRDYARTWDQRPETQRQNLEDMQQLSRLRFADSFPGDARAPGVFAIAMQREYARANWEETVVMAERLVTWQPAPDPELVTEALQLSAHSLFELARYEEAEQAYQQVLVSLPEGDEREADIRKNLAAAIYRQGDQLAQAGDIPGAVGHYLRLGAVVPGSELQANAEYDAGSLLIEAKDWDSAIEVLTAFRTRFPGHPLMDTVPAKLALAYRETEQWELAGDELQQLFAVAATPEEQREALQIAAELYDRAGNTGKAIAAWTRYASSWPEPAESYMEAAHRLAQLYQEQGNMAKRNEWLERQMVRVETLGDQADDRMRYLAASAAATLAREAMARYETIHLTLPLERSMLAKSEALEEVIHAYQRTAAFGVAEFSSEAGYQMARSYARLARDLMESERPPGLSELELEQYELLLEEQAYPFEDNAIDIHEQNVRKARHGLYDEWVRRSYDALRELLPGRYDKTEVRAEVVDELG